MASTLSFIAKESLMTAEKFGQKLTGDVETDFAAEGGFEACGRVPGAVGAVGLPFTGDEGDGKVAPGRE
jgi:hypothetical protein